MIPLGKPIYEVKLPVNHPLTQYLEAVKTPNFINNQKVWVIDIHSLDEKVTNGKYTEHTLINLIIDTFPEEVWEAKELHIRYQR